MTLQQLKYVITLAEVGTITEEEQWAKLKLVKEVAEEVWQDANTSFAGKSTRYSIFFDDKIHLLVGETNKGWYNIHIAIDNSKAKCKDLETIQYGERIGTGKKGCGNDI